MKDPRKQPTLKEALVSKNIGTRVRSWRSWPKYHISNRRMSGSIKNSMAIITRGILPSLKILLVRKRRKMLLMIKRNNLHLELKIWVLIICFRIIWFPISSRKSKMIICLILQVHTIWKHCKSKKNQVEISNRTRIIRTWTSIARYMKRVWWIDLFRIIFHSCRVNCRRFRTSVRGFKMKVINIRMK